MSIVVRAAAAVLLSLALAVSAAAGPLEDKALAYSRNFQEVHSPAFGCSVEVRYVSPDSEVVAEYGDQADSSIWTGNYLAGESYRYAVTGDPEAKAFGLRALGCMLALEEVSGKPGFIARWVGPAEPPFLNGSCTGDCHVLSDGPYAGHYWLGNTSSDQFLGWWYGVSHAYDLLLDGPEDEALRARVRAAMARVLDTIRADDYKITDPDGSVSTAGPGITGNEALGIHLIGARVLGGAYAELMPTVRDEQMFLYLGTNIWPLTRWYQYFAFHLGHMAQHMTMRYETELFWKAVHRGVHRNRLYRNIANTQQVMFDYIAMGEGVIPADPALIAMDRKALLAFPDSKRRIHPQQGPWEPDPVIDGLNEIFEALEDLLGIPVGHARPQNVEPFPLDERCITGFRWQSPPYELCGGSDPAYEFPAPDYVVAYWMGRYYGFLDADD